MPAPVALSRGLSRAYPKPKIDQEWLADCYTWLTTKLNIVNPTNRMDEIIANVEEHLLRSDLRDSMLPGTGFPANLADLENTRLTGPPILVEIVQMTEIGHSAFNLMSVRQTRIDRADLAGLERGDEDEDRYEDPDDDAPIPKYPRSMLKLFLSDGTVTIPAIEYRKLPQLVLGETPLGRKMLLKNVLIRRGMAFLEPKNVEIKGYDTEGRVANQDRDFLAGLRARLGLPVEDLNDTQEQDHPRSPQQEVHDMDHSIAPVAAQSQLPPPSQPPPPPSPPQLPLFLPPSPPQASQFDDVIDIDDMDDEDNEDKENIPVSTHTRVRQRAGPPPSQADEGDVIYISD